MLSETNIEPCYLTISFSRVLPYLLSKNHVCGVNIGIWNLRWCSSADMRGVCNPLRSDTNILKIISTDYTSTTPSAIQEWLTGWLLSYSRLQQHLENQDDQGPALRYLRPSSYRYC